MGRESRLWAMLLSPCPFRVRGTPPPLGTSSTSSALRWAAPGCQVLGASQAGSQRIRGSCLYLGLTEQAPEGWAAWLRLKLIAC